MIKVAPSILSADFSDMGREAARIENWGADYIHFDVMDGCFVPNITFGPAMCEAVRKHTNLPLDVHLMVERPENWIKRFCDAGADIITFHIEADKHAHRTLERIHSLGKRAGIALNPATSPAAVEFILPDCDMVLVMSVNPGFGGQKFIPGAIEKISQLKQMAQKRGLEFEIEVDGGVAPLNAPSLRSAGANVLVAGNAIFHALDPFKAVRGIRGE